MRKSYTGRVWRNARALCTGAVVAPGWGRKGVAMSRVLDAIGLRPAARMLVAGVAAVLLATGAMGCSSGGTAQADDAPAAERQQAESAAGEGEPSGADVDVSGKSWNDIISEEMLDEDGVLLTTQELADYIGVPVSELSEYPGDIQSCLEEWGKFHRSNLDFVSCETMDFNGSTVAVLRVSCHFEDGFTGDMALMFDPESEKFEIRISDIYASTSYQFESDVIPEFTELERLFLENAS